MLVYHPPFKSTEPYSPFMLFIFRLHAAFRRSFILIGAYLYYTSRRNHRRFSIPGKTTQCLGCHLTGHFPHCCGGRSFGVWLVNVCRAPIQPDAGLELMNTWISLYNVWTDPLKLMNAVITWSRCFVRLKIYHGDSENYGLATREKVSRLLFVAALRLTRVDWGLRTIPSYPLLWKTHPSSLTYTNTFYMRNAKDYECPWT